MIVHIVLPPIHPPIVDQYLIIVLILFLEEEEIGIILSHVPLLIYSNKGMEMAEVILCPGEWVAFHNRVHQGHLDNKFLRVVLVVRLQALLLVREWLFSQE
jgi:hypothetical protein